MSYETALKEMRNLTTPAAPSKDIAEKIQGFQLMAKDGDPASALTLLELEFDNFDTIHDGPDLYHLYKAYEEISAIYTPSEIAKLTIMAEKVNRLYPFPNVDV